MHKRWRKRILTIAACAVAGVVVTVAVAWGCYFNPGGIFLNPGGNSVGSVRFDYGGHSTEFRWSTGRFGFRNREDSFIDPVTGIRVRESRVEVGVPVQALVGTRVRAPGIDTFPLIPLWPGFAVDTALYGTLAFLLWTTPGFIRRHSRRNARRRRGQCLACGYSRSGLPGDAPCPECGGMLDLCTSAGEGGS